MEISKKIPKLNSALQDIVCATNGLVMRYKRCESLQEAIQVIASASYSANASMTHFTDTLDSDSVVSKLADHILEKKALALLCDIQFSTSMDCGTHDELCAYLKTPDLLEIYKKSMFYKTSGDVGFGWVKYDNFYFAYIAFPRYGTVIKDAEDQGFIALPAYEERKVYEIYRGSSYKIVTISREEVIDTLVRMTNRSHDECSSKFKEMQGTILDISDVRVRSSLAYVITSMWHDVDIISYINAYYIPTI